MSPARHAWELGYNSWEQGDQEDDNPYAPHTEESEQWEYGFNAALDDNVPISERLKKLRRAA